MRHEVTNGKDFLTLCSMHIYIYIIKVLAWGYASVTRVPLDRPTLVGLFPRASHIGCLCRFCVRHWTGFTLVVAAACSTCLEVPELSKIPGQLPRGLADLFGGDRASILRFLFFVAYLAVIGLSTAFILWLCYLAGQVYAFSDCPDCHSCFDHWGFQRLLLPGGVLCAEQELWPATSGTCTALVRRH